MPSTVPKIIDDSIRNNLLNVFFITSPIVAIIAKMIILKFKINPKNVLIFSFRNTDLSILNYEYVFVNQKYYDRYFEKLFFQSPSGKRILRKIKSFNKSFLLFAPIAFREVNYILKSGLCNGHLYIEEGQHSFFEIDSYNPFKINFFDKVKKNWNTRFSEKNESGFYYRNDADFFIGISEGIFPLISKEKVIILDNIKEIRDLYSPVLKGIKIIGLTCAERRIHKDKWPEMIQQLIKYLPVNSYVKPHPSFTANTLIYNKFINVFNNVTNGKYKICKNNTILELEMMYEKKELVGPVSSLSKYAEMMGSKYKQINLY